MKTRSSIGYLTACYGSSALDKITSSVKVSIFCSKVQYISKKKKLYVLKFSIGLSGYVQDDKVHFAEFDEFAELAKLAQLRVGKTRVVGNPAFELLVAGYTWLVCTETDDRAAARTCSDKKLLECS
jgi:hypothetical protein